MADNSVHPYCFRCFYWYHEDDWKAGECWYDPPCLMPVVRRTQYGDVPDTESMNPITPEKRYCHNFTYDHEAESKNIKGKEEPQ